MTTVVVINPRAGNGSIGRAWPEFSGLLHARIGDHGHTFARGPGDVAGQVAAAVAEGATRVIVVGGDGTVNEAVNGLAGATGMPPTGVVLGLISAGSGSDFARSLGIPADPKAAIERIAAGRTRRIDLGRVTYTDTAGESATRLFANIASFGISGLIDQKVNAAGSNRLLPGKLSYYLATVSALLGYRFQTVTVAIDDRAPVERAIALVAVANNRFFGGGMMVAPDAEPDDGIFDVVTLQSASKLTLLKDLRLVYRGGHRDHPAITIERGRRVRAEPRQGEPGPVLIDIDGEPLGRLPATFDMVPRALDILC